MDNYPVISITNFTTPTKHPWSMLDHLSIEHKYEWEGFLAWFLMKSIKNGKFDWIQCQLNHDELVSAGLLEAKENQTYRLSNTAIELLYKYYGKVESEKSNS